MRWCHQDGPSLSMAAPFSRQLRHRSCLAAPRGGDRAHEVAVLAVVGKVAIRDRTEQVINHPPLRTRNYCQRSLKTRDFLSRPGVASRGRARSIAVLAMSSRPLHRQLPPEIDVPLRGMVSHEGQGLLQRPSMHNL